MSACSEPDPLGPAADAMRVDISDNEFSPQSVTIARGKTVAWTNSGRLSHRIVFTASPLSTHDIRPTTWAELRFDDAGTLTYECALHPQKTGTVTVQ